MGKPMSATPTPESMVWQGGANTLENRCHTTPPLTGGRGWWGVHHLFGVGWGNDLVPMPPFPSGQETGGRTCAFALCLLVRRSNYARNFCATFIQGNFDFVNCECVITFFSLKESRQCLIRVSAGCNANACSQCRNRIVAPRVKSKAIEYCIFHLLREETDPKPTLIQDDGTKGKFFKHVLSRVANVCGRVA